MFTRWCMTCDFIICYTLSDLGFESSQFIYVTLYICGTHIIYAWRKSGRSATMQGEHRQCGQWIGLWRSRYMYMYTVSSLPSQLDRFTRLQILMERSASHLWSSTMSLCWWLLSCQGHRNQFYTYMTHLAPSTICDYNNYVYQCRFVCGAVW